MDTRAAPGSTEPGSPGAQPWEHATDRYLVRFARDAEDLDRVLRLRYEIFNLELGEGLERSHEMGRDRDEFDSFCEHVMVIDHRRDEVVGTYRLLAAERARTGPGFYADREFDLSALPDEVRKLSVELGRACVAAKHRRRPVLALLFRAIGVFMQRESSRYLFGCGSLPTLDASVAHLALAELQRRRLLHPQVQLPVRADYADPPPCAPDPAAAEALFPRLFETYFGLGARVCSGPAFDLEFGTTDFFLLFDLSTIDERTHSKYRD